MRKELRQKIIEVCDQKVEKKGPDVGLSFYAFFKNKNDQPEVLMEAAKWWIETHQLDHFEKASKIKAMVQAGS
ncbi:DUF6500 family protein [Gynuella sunshinyii]|uniref:Msl2237 protein n=1 Tax=Gynuella sunshinyii YC6258 TaxID=1445510 RepID=A0A0C5VFW6_9GAMM|nr:DUF6500 family protein [Gynuella sunshinyii]AJQ92253.1 hypothetical Protein YC6258_00201 [Gynuella sunshinyii YC6258]